MNPINKKHKTLLLLLIAAFHTSPVASTDYHPVTKNSLKVAVALTDATSPSELTELNSIVSVQYSDGLGRPTMAVRKSIKTGVDMVTLVGYNAFGEVGSQWLPAPITSTTAIPSCSTVMQAAKTFYADDMPYSSISSEYDESGLTETVIVAGKKWHDGNKTQQQRISNSSGTAAIRRYVVVGNTLELYPVSGNLTTVKVKNTDADGKEAFSYIDGAGRTLMQRTVSALGVNHDTYYVYNDLGQLCFVLSPEASNAMITRDTTYLVGGTNTAGNALSQFGYVYRYNAKGQCIAKKLPGKDWTYMVYDKGGRLAFSQEGNQRSGGWSSVWTFYRYDALGRLAQSGTSQYDPESPPNYDSQSALATYNTGTGYSSTAPLGTNTKVLTQNFYDSYDFINLGYSTPAQKTNLAYVAQTGTNETKDWNMRYSNTISGADIATRGQLTGTYVAELKSSGSIITAMYYNDRGQVIQSKSNNHMNGFDNDYFTYNFAGQMLTNKHMHTGPNPAITETYSYRYNKAAQLTSISQKVNTSITVQMDSLEYDDLGRVTRKLIHGCMHATSYAYNIHNQLKSINSLRFSELINYEEDDADGHPAFNGNIASVSYGAGSTYKYKYRYAYDGMNRLTEAKHFDLLTPTIKDTYNEEIGEYDLNGNVKALTRSGLVKDFKNMQGTTPDIVAHNMDQLTLTYAGNQLTAVADANKVQEFAPVGNNDFRDEQSATQPTEYYYDANGNQTGDYNKDVAWTKYNMLNQPEKIQFRHGNKTEYTYYADGTKHQALYSMSMNSENIPMAGTAYGEEIENNNISSTFKVDYCGRYIYENNVLVRILTPEGYMQRTTPSSAWTYWYNLKDHLGNTHVNLQSQTLAFYSTKIYFLRGTTEYYPSGMEIMPTATNSSGTNPYLYSGKELDRMHGLNEYDFSARWYDYAGPGFTTMDPHAENHYSESPYSYCGGNPINRTDPTGMDWYTNQEKDQVWWFKGQSKDKYSEKGVTYYHVGEFIKYKDAKGHLVYGDDKGEKNILLPEVTVKETPNPKNTGGRNGSGSSGTENQTNGDSYIAQHTGSDGSWNNFSPEENDAALKFIVGCAASLYGGAVFKAVGKAVTGGIGVATKALPMAVNMLSKTSVAVEATAIRGAVYLGSGTAGAASANVVGGMAEGYLKGKYNMSPDMPFLFDNPAWQVGSNIGNDAYYFYHYKK